MADVNSNLGSADGHPGAVSPEDLLAYVDGEAPANIVAHVRTCPTCTEEAAAYAQLRSRLSRALYRFDCPPPQALGEYDLGMVSPEERSAIAAHVWGCVRCTDELTQLRGFLATELMPTGLAVGTAGVIEGVRRVLATLVPPPAPAFAGLRGAGDEAAWTYQAEGLTINLVLNAGANGRRGRQSLAGLVFGDGAPGLPTDARATLVDAAGTSRTTEIDDLGNFTFDDVDSDVYRLEVLLGDRVVVVEGLQVGG